MLTSKVYALPSEMRARAKEARRLGFDAGAAVWMAAADLVIRRLDEMDFEIVSATQAARLSGYNPRTLVRMADAGKLTNYGEPGAPRFRVAELPRKPGAQNRAKSHGAQRAKGEAP